MYFQIVIIYHYEYINYVIFVNVNSNSIFINVNSIFINVNSIFINVNSKFANVI